MSVSFYIKNKKKFFGYEKVMKVKEIIDLFKEYKLSIYNIDFDADGFNKEKFYNTSIISFLSIFLSSITRRQKQSTCV